MKNAYSLLGMQRFEHAAAFFLLAGALWDAVQVCYHQDTYFLSLLQYVLVIINSVYYDKLLIFIGAMFRQKLASYHQAVD